MSIEQAEKFAKEASQSEILMKQQTEGLRDYFAGQALVGVSSLCVTGGVSYEALASDAYHLADAMLAERSKGK